MVRIIASSARRRREQSVITSPRTISFLSAYSPTQRLFKLRPLLFSKNIATRSQSIWRILDYYAVHRQEAMKQYTAEFGINLLFIPPGLTDELQPLDHLVFRAMTANCRQIYRVQAAEEGVMNKQVAASFLIRAWEWVSAAVLDEAWAIHEGFNRGED
jgi:hypothetical protein